MSNRQVWRFYVKSITHRHRKLISRNIFHMQVIELKNYQICNFGFFSVPQNLIQKVLKNPQKTKNAKRRKRKRKKRKNRKKPKNLKKSQKSLKKLAKITLWPLLPILILKKFQMFLVTGKRFDFT